MNVIKYRCVESQIYCGCNSIKVLYYFIHHVLIFRHSAPFYYRCIMSFANSMYVNAALQTYITNLLNPIAALGHFYGSVLEEPICNMRIINHILQIICGQTCLFCIISRLWSSGQCKSAELNVKNTRPCDLICLIISDSSHCLAFQNC